MKKVRKSIILLLVLVLISVLTLGCGGSDKGATGGEDKKAADGGDKNTDKQYSIKITHVLAENHHYTKGAAKFKELIEERSGGKIKVEIFPNAQLGGERAILEGLQMGTIEMGIITSGPLSGFVPEFGILDLGYLFRDSAEAMKILNGPVGEDLSKKMLDIGIRNLGFIKYEFRSVYGNKPIKTPADLAGIKIRTMENPAHQALFKALGASPTPMAWPELYTGLQQGTVHAAENSPDVLAASKQYEVAKHYSLTNHVFNNVMYMVSEKFYQSLPAELQEMVVQAAKEAREYEDTLIEQDIAKALEEMKNAGVQVYEIDDMTPFHEAAQISWDEVIKNIPDGGENLKKILEAEGRSK